MFEAEQKRENSLSLMFIGLAVWVADLLVVFFLPASFRVGRETVFLGIIALLGALGLFLIVSGFINRATAGPEE